MNSEEVCFMAAWMLCDGPTSYNPKTGKPIDYNGGTYVELKKEYAALLSKHGGTCPLVDLNLLRKSKFWYPNKVVTTKTAKPATKQPKPVQTNTITTCTKTTLVSNEDKEFLRKWDDSKGTKNPTSGRNIASGSKIHLECSTKAEQIRVLLSQPK